MQQLLHVNKMTESHDTLELESVHLTIIATDSPLECTVTTIRKSTYEHKRPPNSQTMTSKTVTACPNPSRQVFNNFFFKLALTQANTNSMLPCLMPTQYASLAPPLSLSLSEILPTSNYYICHRRVTVSLFFCQ